MRNDLWDVINTQVPIGELEKHYPAKRVIKGQCVEPYVIRDGRCFLQFASLDYLSLANHPKVKQAAIDAINEYGIGSLASPLATGTIDIHLLLRDKLANYMGTESAVVFTSGMLTNIGAITAIIDSQFRFMFGRPSRATRTIFTDELNHQSIHMACDIAKARGAEVYTYRHSDIHHLAHLVEQKSGDLSLIITDALFSMNGDKAPLAEIVRVAESFQSEKRKIVIYADDAHGVGVLGANGRGTIEECGVENDVVRMGVISKSFGTLGGYVVGEDWFVNYLRHCTTQMFSMGVPASETAATIVALDIAQKEPWRRQTVLAHAKYLRDNLISSGFEVLGDTHIVPVVIGDETEAGCFAQELERCGILAPEIRYPIVPKGRALIRLAPVFDNTKADLDLLLNAFFDIARKSNVLTIAA